MALPTHDGLTLIAVVTLCHSFDAWTHGRMDASAPFMQVRGRLFIAWFAVWARKCVCVLRKNLAWGSLSYVLLFPGTRQREFSSSLLVCCVRQAF